VRDASRSRDELDRWDPEMLASARIHRVAGDRAVDCELSSLIDGWLYARVFDSHWHGVSHVAGQGRGARAADARGAVAGLAP
jgi:hypothetical protein